MDFKSFGGSGAVLTNANVVETGDEAAVLSVWGTWLKESPKLVNETAAAELFGAEWMANGAECDAAEKEEESTTGEVRGHANVDAETDGAVLVIVPLEEDRVEESASAGWASGFEAVNGTAVAGVSGSDGGDWKGSEAERDASDKKEEANKDKVEGQAVIQEETDGAVIVVLEAERVEVGRTSSWASGLEVVIGTAVGDVSGSDGGDWTGSEAERDASDKKEEANKDKVEGQAVIQEETDGAVIVSLEEDRVEVGGTASWASGIEVVIGTSVGKVSGSGGGDWTGSEAERDEADKEAEAKTDEVEGGADIEEDTDGSVIVALEGDVVEAIGTESWASGLEVVIGTAVGKVSGSDFGDWISSESEREAAEEEVEGKLGVLWVRGNTEADLSRCGKEKTERYGEEDGVGNNWEHSYEDINGQHYLERDVIRGVFERSKADPARRAFLEAVGCADAISVDSLGSVGSVGNEGETGNGGLRGAEYVELYEIRGVFEPRTFVPGNVEDDFASGFEKIREEMKQMREAMKRAAEDEAKDEAAKSSATRAARKARRLTRRFRKNVKNGLIFLANGKPLRCLSYLAY